MGMYAQFTTFRTQPGKADELISLLKQASEGMQSHEACRLYVVGQEDHEPDSVRVFEIWDSKAEHSNSLHDPRARDLIARALPLLAGKPEATELTLIDGTAGMR
jgi:quinol monooxygenase YgiN